MALDGSFSMEGELKRFLNRCPEIKLIQFVDDLLKKGGKFTEVELVGVLARLVLHPKYTVALLGCFRPIAKKIVDSTVALLRLVPDLRSERGASSDVLDIDGVLYEDDRVYDVWSLKGLHLHELACLALCRTLDLFPFLLRTVLDYFSFAPTPFERFFLRESLLKALHQDLHQFLNVIRTSYRFLVLETEVFKTLWDWSCFLDLVQLLTELHPTIDFPSREMISDLRWCSLGILSLVLRLNFETSDNLCMESKEAFQSFLRWQDFCMDVLREKAGWHVQSFAEGMERTDANLNGGSFLLRCQLATFSKHPGVVEQNGIVLKGEDGSPLLVTSAMAKSLEMISLAVSQRWPVLLYGPPGSGKTSVIKKLACSQGSRVLSIHMDEQADGKTLVGSYVSTEQPGEFLWQPGLLTQAVVNGFWVVFEDIDKAPLDIFSILLPLLEGAHEFSTGHGQTLKVNDGFRLLATLTSTNPVTSSFMEGRHSLGAAWLKVMIDAPSNLDLLNVMLVWYPELEPVAGKLIETFETVNQLLRSQLGLTISSTFQSRFTLRDLLKLSKRIASLGFYLGKGSLSSYTCESICKEAIDAFASFTTSETNRLAIIREISRLWGVPACETLYPVNKPVFQESNSIVQVGRVSLQRTENALNYEKKPFVELRASVYALERIASSVKFNEPVLLVGETGTGKTTLVQTLASRLGQKLTVLNLSQQSDVADLLGGFKPVGGHFICIPLYQEFENLFTSTFSFKDNEVFLCKLRKFLTDKNWKKLLNGFQKSFRKVVEIGKFSPGEKRKRPLSERLLKDWQSFSTKVERAQAQVNASDGMIFSFVEGAFISALRDGGWILLDEVNLAPPEILQRVIGVLDDEKGSLCLAEKGDINYVCRHPNFRLFACMNPANDAGKRDLGNSLRGRFTEYFVDDTLNDDDLILFVKCFVDADASSQKIASNIVRFYKEAKKSEERLQDGANQRPHYSLRSLYRALEYVKKARCFGFERSLYDGFSMFFMNLLDDSSSKLMSNLICKHFLGTVAPPQSIPFDKYLVNKASSSTDEILNRYVLTKSVKEHLRNLAQAIFVSRYPVLLQGPTSSGKTSLVRFLAAITGHEFVRINNHEHTDLQEYLGSYITDGSGRLVFQEGALVKAVRKGHWVVLDELNLAPSDVLEALNRLLDDNRELYVPELRETIHSHPEFMLFATQNPPVVYGGRKMLSRAFRNRFTEIHVDDIPQEELTTILEKSCQVPESRAKKIVDIMNELHLQRQSSKIFAGKHGYITPRDLFRWAKRFTKFGDRALAYDGYYLMAERLRADGERTVVKDILEKHLKVKFSDDDLYKKVESEGGVLADGANKLIGQFESIGKIIWTRSLWRAYFLVERCYMMREPVLLVGETGGGKTTVCQLLSSILGSKLHTLNCHQYTETADFLGGFYPVRERSGICADFQNLCDKLAHSTALIHYPGDAEISSNINNASITLNALSMIIKSYKDGSVFHPDVTEQEIANVEKVYQSLIQLEKRWRTIFLWQDGPLVEAMKRGELFLVDEISLADDSVLERLNSVLEPERKLSLTEKGGPELETVDAHENFFLLATMNPGGDYGKKELSPALRNRFTEIWVPSVSDIDDLKSIAVNRLSNSGLAYLVDIMLNFWEWFNLLQSGRILTVRDLLSWVSFINATEGNLSAESAFVHGAFLVLLDGLLLGTNISKVEAAELRVKCFKFLLERLKVFNPSSDRPSIGELQSYGWPDVGNLHVTRKPESMENGILFGFHPFFIEKGTNCPILEGYEFLAPTTCRNALRVLRALQLKKPVLLEGSPGVGKTSLVIALGKFSGHPVVRINLSEQTDIMDLLGSDLPVESEEGIQFAWSDGILLQALKKGSWVLLDELNLAPQSVLEGLNSILDHRAEIFIPELSQSFKCPASFRVFACQNPSCEGGGRKSLPRSFLNRFTKVYVDELVEDDYLSICSSQFPSIERSLLSSLIMFNKRLHQETMVYHKFGQDGSPWEFNLRDVIRSCQIIQAAPESVKSTCFLNPIYLQRIRTPADRQEVLRLYENTFGVKPFVNLHPKVKLAPHSLSVGSVSIERHSCTTSISSDKLMILPGLRHCLQAIVHCVKHQWLCILVGPSSSGKTSIIRLLAGLTGNVLNELNLSSATDISELLGCFEQYNTSRHYHLAIAQVERYMNDYSNSIGSSLDDFSKGKGLVARWLAFLSNVNPSLTLLDNQRMNESIQQLAAFLECLRAHVCEQELSFSWSAKDLDSTLSMILKLGNEFQKKNYSVKFEWVTGSLVKAIENGEWIVLENANLCNPTVLDRINSLVEQSGSITINECGIVDGGHVVLRPHPKFRMFLTVNPSFGEVSRAMRNRGVEIYMMHPHWQMDEKSCLSSYEIELRETKRFIALSGIPVRKLVETMAKTHLYAKREGSQFNVSITNLELSRWVKLFYRLIMNGNQSAWSLLKSWEYTYLSPFADEKGKEIVSQAALSFLLKSEPFRFASNKDSLLRLPVVWSTPLKLKDYVIHPTETFIRQNVAYLESMGSQSEVDQDLTLRKLSFAADWAIEQATEGDYLIYISCFEWFGTRLLPFFSRFSALLKRELQHCIWQRIFQLRNHLKSLDVIGIDFSCVPMLSVKQIDICQSVAVVDSCKILLNCIQCVPLLRRSLQQWSNEDDLRGREQTLPFLPALSSLRRVEEKVLDSLVGSPSFDVLFNLYSALLEHHMMFWKSIISSQGESQQIFGNYLIKYAIKLQVICLEEAALFQAEMQRANLSFTSGKSLLLTRGCHFVMPSSADQYQIQCQLSDFCNTLSPRKYEFLKQDAEKLKEVTVNGAMVANVELRVLAMEGLGMSSSIIGKNNYSEIEIVQKLEDIYQRLVRRLDIEKQKLVLELEADTDSPLHKGPPGCCVFTPVSLSRSSGFMRWLSIQPILDETSLAFDLELLQDLTRISLFDTEKQYNALQKLSGPLRSSLNFSLYYSSRSPVELLPHQNILWTIDAWTSLTEADREVSSCILQLWLWWHTSLWEVCPLVAERLTQESDFCTTLPCKLFWPLKSSTVDNILQSVVPVTEYHMHGLNLRAASHNLWQSSASIKNVLSMLSSVVRSLFQQIIYAHKKSFKDSRYTKIRSAFHSIQECTSTENLETLISLLKSSDVFTSLIDSYIEPLLRQLYPLIPTNDIRSVGCSLLHLGGLRCTLIVRCTNLEPSLKYLLKHSELVQKIASVKMEAEVREECIYLAGTYERGENCRETLLEELNAERIRMQKKIVYRPKSLKFEDLKKLLSDIVEWIRGFKSFRREQVQNCQVVLSNFIDRLSNEYSAFKDIAEPVQVALYEMKLGLSLMFSSEIYGAYLENSKHYISSFLDFVYELMKFPRAPASTRVCAGKVPVLSAPSNAVGVDGLQYMFSYAKNSTSTAHSVPNLMALALPSKMSIYQNILQRIKDCVTVSRFLGDASFKLLSEIFDEIASLWVEHRVKNTINKESGQFKFRARAFKMASIIEIDVSNCVNLLPNDSFSEWLELLSEDLEEKISVEGNASSMDHDWDVKESDLDGIVDIHNQLFGAVDLVQRLGRPKVAEMDMMQSFVGSYMTGLRMIKDLKGTVASCVDAVLAPEHLLCLCLEHGSKIFPSNKMTCTCNFYKGSNSLMIVKVIEPVTLLKNHIISLLKEYDSPALQRILEVIDMILALPLDSPPAKALSALEFLLSRIWVSQGEVAKFSMTECSQPILALMGSWYQLEFESWPALLDEVDSHIERNVGKLWFPLYSVLLRSLADDLDEHKSLAIESLQEFFSTSTIGEFKKQLQLLVSFHGQINTDLRWKNNMGFMQRPWQVENAKILYNVFGFYIQLLPKILGHIGEHRRTIEKELNQLLKLCRWDHISKHLTVEAFGKTIENIRRTRLKLRKLVKKYTDLLQQPLMEYLSQEIQISGAEGCAEGQSSLVDRETKTVLESVADHIDLNNKEGILTWFDDWQKSLRSMDGEALSAISTTGIFSQSSCFLERKEVWNTLEELCARMLGFGGLWDDKTKNLIKRRQFSELFDFLEGCGLSKHRPVMEQGQFSKSKRWILQPAYEVHHLLTHSDDSPGNINPSHIQSLSHDILWKLANKFYFMSISKIMHLGEVSLKFHKDINNIQVARSCSYVDDLFEIQQEQREIIYDFSKKLKSLRQCTWSLSKFFSLGRTNTGCFPMRDQLSIFECLWQQKQIIDNLCTLLHEEQWFLETVEKNHLSSCTTLKGEAVKILSLIQNVLPIIKESKDTMDKHLLGFSGDGHTEGITFLQPYGINHEMEQLIYENFENFKALEKNLSAFFGQDYRQDSVPGILLGRIEALLGQARHFKEMCYSSRQTGLSENAESSARYKASFDAAVKETFSRIAVAFESIQHLNCDFTSNMKEWKPLFEKHIEYLQLDLIHKNVIASVQNLGELLNSCGGENIGLTSSIHLQLKNMYDLLEKLLAFGDNLLLDLLRIHGVVCEVTFALANVFSSLFVKGFGSLEDVEDSQEVVKDASGTGMGEGVGATDVSDQISDEDQLLGSSQKPNEESKAPDDTTSKNDKGIEMEQDFDADAFSVSEDSNADDNEDESDGEQPESAMGAVGENSNVVDEKVGEQGDDDEDCNTREKYEQGQSVKDGSQEDELRAKEDSAATQEGDTEFNDARESAEKNDEDHDVDDTENGDGNEDMTMDKDEAFADPSGINPDQIQKPDESIMDEMHSDQPAADGESEDMEDNEMKDEEGKVDEVIDEVDTKKDAEDTEMTDAEEAGTENLDGKKDTEMPKQEHEQLNSKDGTSQAGGQSTEIHNDAINLDESGSDDVKNDLAPTSRKPNASESEVTIADSSTGDRLSVGNPISSQSSSEAAAQRLPLNPFRNIGNALEGWKERVTVSVDLQKEDVIDGLVDDNAVEYGYTAELQESTAQALGPATADQNRVDVSQREDTDMDLGNSIQKETYNEVQIEKRNPENLPIRNLPLNHIQDANPQQETVDHEQGPGESMEIDGENSQDNHELSDSVVTMNRAYMSETANQYLDPSSKDDQLGHAFRFEASSDVSDAAAHWRRFELLTTRLSHELVEQLRLVLEPTVASKLQGYYRTGKRINMKKVILYIASHYRKDKLWLRRTKPSKRDYQVVIAVDDSRSMSEWGCGNFALEALVTVCRAMSQLEVGRLAVASFGQQGNIKLLHDFDQPFTPEAGIKMISSFTFKQENTIANEPMADLMKYLDNMLDAAVMRARLPSGENPLQQLVLIIADGRFSEKEKLKRRVRDILSKQRMVAFLILDSPKSNESILEFQEATIQGGKHKISKYLDTFPFPYYVVLKNIEALPRTLADLLRQWFELMQYNRD